MRRTIRAGLRIGLVLVPVATATFSPGCGGEADPLPRQPVSGTVTLKGVPLPAGMIQFQPTSPGEVTAGGAGISNGNYSIAKVEGLVPGTYRVTITSGPTAAQPADAMPGDAPPPPKETIPARYNVKSTLTAQVKADGPNKFDFDLGAK